MEGYKKLKKTRNIQKSSKSENSELHYFAAFAIFQILLLLINLNRFSWNWHSFYSSISFRWQDQPWMPPNFNPVPIFHGHYFGDFQLSTVWERLANPYEQFESFSFGLPPSALLIFSPFSFLTPRFGYLLYFLLTITILIYATYNVIGA
jgi:hypothetical protein